jgi:hypothetical protein
MQTLQEFARDPQHLGAELGSTAVLHTWGQTLTEHIHVHCIVRRFPGKVIPLYSAVHDDYASKRQNAVENTRGEGSKRGRRGPYALGQSDTGSAVGRREDDRGGAASVSGRDDPEILSRQRPVCGDRGGVEP